MHPGVHPSSSILKITTKKCCRLKLITSQIDTVQIENVFEAFRRGEMREAVKPAKEIDNNSFEKVLDIGFKVF